MNGTWIVVNKFKTKEKGAIWGRIFEKRIVGQKWFWNWETARIKRFWAGVTSSSRDVKPKRPRHQNTAKILPKFCFAGDFWSTLISTKSFHRYTTSELISSNKENKTLELGYQNPSEGYKFKRPDFKIQQKYCQNFVLPKKQNYFSPELQFFFPLLSIDPY